jgi:hypothetical protein
LVAAANTIFFAVSLSLVLVACGRDGRGAAADTSQRRAQAAPLPIDTIDGCVQTKGTRPDTSLTIGSEAAERWQRALARGAEYRCLITPQMQMRVVLVSDTTLPSLDSLLVFASDESIRPSQVLSVESADLPQPYIPDLLRAVDVDADGYRDLMMGTSWGATGNTAYAVWRFDPRTRRFAEDTVLSTMFNPSPVAGRPCVTTYSNSSARDDGSGLYCLRDGRWMLDSMERHEWDRTANAVVHTIAVRRGDSLVTVKRETVPDSS